MVWQLLSEVEVSALILEAAVRVPATQTTIVGQSQKHYCSFCARNLKRLLCFPR